MANKDLASIGDIYGGMLSKFKHDNHLTNESHKQNAFDSNLDLVGDGPHVDGVECDIEDKYDDDNTLVDHHPDEECGCKVVTVKKVKISEEKQKSNEKVINRNMSKSKFDSIVKKVLRENFGQDDSELDALGLDDATPDSEFDFEDEGMDDEGGDEITVTIPRDVAQQLVDLLQGVLGGGEEDFGDDDDLGGDEDLDLDFDMGGDEGMDEDNEDMYDEDEMDFEEDEEGMPTQKGKGSIGKDHSKPAGPKKSTDKKKTFQLPKSNKVGGKANPKGGKAKAEVTDEQGTTVTTPSYAKLQGKDNKAPGVVKPGDFFK